MLWRVLWVLKGFRVRTKVINGFLRMPASVRRFKGFVETVSRMKYECQSPSSDDKYISSSYHRKTTATHENGNWKSISHREKFYFAGAPPTSLLFTICLFALYLRIYFNHSKLFIFYPRFGSKTNGQRSDGWSSWPAWDEDHSSGARERCVASRWTCLRAA